MFYYVYILQNKIDPSKHYTGYITNLKARLEKHNEGGVTYTSKLKSWQIKTAIAFNNKEKALLFEQYLKGHSGRAFVKKHL